MIVVADSGPLHYLILLEHIELLRRFYGQVLVPEPVANELSAAVSEHLRLASGLGWSSDEHPGHVLFPSFAVLLAHGTSRRVSDTLLADLDSMCRDPLEALSSDDVERRPNLGTPSIATLIQDVSSTIMLAEEDLLPRNRMPGTRRAQVLGCWKGCTELGCRSGGASLRFSGRGSGTGGRAPSGSCAPAPPGTRSARATRGQTRARAEPVARARRPPRRCEALHRRQCLHAGSARARGTRRSAGYDGLVYGESGTGKEFIVRLIHDQSPRASGPFVSINCAALTETLLESELFGHVRGAFTGAVRDKAGLCEVAGNGTLFLDEIGEVAPTVQAKLLRALQEREIRRVGAECNVKVNARVVAATNRDLRAAVDAGTFREDLYFRLGAFVITVPPLRERRENLPPLVHDFLGRAATRVKKDVKTVSPDAMTALMNYGWPGNVRELEHAIERAVIVVRGTSVNVRELPPEVSQKTRQRPSDDSLDLQAQERAMIERALERFRGNRRQAAEALKISTVMLWRKMKQYGLGA